MDGACGHLSPVGALAHHPVRRRAPTEVASRPERCATIRLVTVASVTVTFLAASSAPTPLYDRYQAAWGFSALTTTIVFGIYAIAVLGALLSLGRLSDHVGRRPVLLAGIATEALALAIFADAHSVTALLTARVVQGLATGTAIGAVGAAMLDLDPARGAVANATAPGVGTASGASLSACAVQWLPAPTHLVYLVLIGVLAVQAAAVSALPETSPRAPGAWRSLVPRIALPSQTQGPMLAAGPVLLAVWALVGFYGSLAPSLVGHLAGSGSVVEGGLALGILAGVAAATTYVLRDMPAPRAMLTGTISLSAGVSTALLGVLAGSVVAFFAGTVIAGIGFGAGFQGGVRLVAPLARPDQRAGVLSVLFTVSYLSMGLPAVIGGFAVVRGGGLLPTTYGYGLAVIGLAALATVNLLRLGNRARPADVPTIDRAV